MTQGPDQAQIDSRILTYYGRGREGGRLASSAGGVLEFRRTQELVHAALTRAHSPGDTRALQVADIGGGTGVHAAPLADAGHDVFLLDPVPEHIEAARTLPGVRAALGDARRLPLPAHSIDAALLLGPLYHLALVEDRAAALSEAMRVLRPGGVLVAAAITRLPSAIDSYLATAAAATVNGADRSTWDESWREILEDGWTTADEVPFPFGHFHTAPELAAEMRAAGAEDVEVHGVEGPISVAAEALGSDDDAVEPLLDLARRTSEHAFLRELSPHLLAIGRVPDSQSM